MADRYVANPADGGSDSNPGTSGSPYATIQKAADNVAAGETVYIHGGTNGTYSQTTISLSASGTAGNLIQWKTWPSTGQVWIRNSSAVKLYDTQIIVGWPVAYNRFDGLGFGGPSGSLTDQAIRFQSSSQPDFNTTQPDALGNEVINCTFSNIGHDGGSGGVGENAFWGMIFFAWGKNCLANNNSIDSCHGIMIRTSGEYLCTISNNTITNMKKSVHDGATSFPQSSHGIWMGDNSSTWSPGSTMKLNGYHTIEDNVIDGSDGTSAAYEDSGIRMDTGSHNHTIRRNTVKNLAGGFGIFPESRVMNCLIYDNITVNCAFGFSTADPTIGRTRYHTVANNIFYGGEVGMAFRQTGNIFSANNICYGASRAQVLTTTDSVGQSNVWKKNLYFKSGNSNIGAWNTADVNIDTTTANRTVSQWMTDSGETGAVGTDPSFVSPGSDFHLNSGSPAIDAGEPSLSTATITYSRSYNGSAPDIGKYETTPAAAGMPPTRSFRILKIGKIA